MSSINDNIPEIEKSENSATTTLNSEIDNNNDIIELDLTKKSEKIQLSDKKRLVFASDLSCSTTNANEYSLNQKTSDDINSITMELKTDLKIDESTCLIKDNCDLEDGEISTYKTGSTTLKYNSENFDFYTSMVVLKTGQATSEDYGTLINPSQNTSENKGERGFKRIISQLRSLRSNNNNQAEPVEENLDDNKLERKQENVFALLEMNSDKSDNEESVSQAFTSPREESDLEDEINSYSSICATLSSSESYEVNIDKFMHRAKPISSMPFSNFMFKPNCPVATSWREKIGTDITKLSFRERLHEELLAFVGSIDLTSSDDHHRQQIFAVIVQLASRLWRHCKIITFGSYATGLSLRDGDIDICLQNVPVQGNHPHSLYVLKSHLSRMPWFCSNIHIINKAKVPLLRFTHVSSKINVDISLNVDSAISSTFFIKNYLSFLAPMRPLILFLKYILKMNDWADTYTGGIGSFLLFVMLSFHFQREYLNNENSAVINPTNTSKHFKVLNNYFTKFVNYEDTYRNLGIELIAFLKRYVSFDYLNESIDLTSKTGTNKINKIFYDDYADISEFRFSIISPISKNEDIGKKTFQIHEIICYFKRLIDRIQYISELELYYLENNDTNTLNQIREKSILSFVFSDIDLNYHNKFKPKTPNFTEYDVYKPHTLPEITKKHFKEAKQLIDELLVENNYKSRYSK